MQLAGPNSRSYGENMLEYAAVLKYFLMFALDGKYPLSDVETDHSWDCAGLMGMAAAPIEVRPEFQAPTVPWREVAVMFRPGMTVRQYREGDLIVGSISMQSIWAAAEKRGRLFGRSRPPPGCGLLPGMSRR